MDMQNDMKPRRSLGLVSLLLLRSTSILFSLIMLTTFTFTQLYAKYVISNDANILASTSDYSSNAVIRYFNGKDSSDAQNIKTGFNGSLYTVEVTNALDRSKPSEVDLIYSIKVTTTGNLPMNYSLKFYRDDYGVGQKPSADAITIPEETFHSEGVTEYIFEGGYMPAKVAQKHIYAINVSWGDNLSVYADTPEMVQITVDIQQILRD